MSLATLYEKLASPEGQMEQRRAEVRAWLSTKTAEELTAIRGELQERQKQASLEKEAEEERARGAFQGQGFIAALKKEGIDLAAFGKVIESAAASGLPPEKLGEAITKAAVLYDSLEEAEKKAAA